MGFFFFSSRRRHTRYWRDWSSDGALPISRTGRRDGCLLIRRRRPAGGRTKKPPVLDETRRRSSERLKTGWHASWRHSVPSRGKSELHREPITAHRSIACLFCSPPPSPRPGPVVPTNGAAPAVAERRNTALRMNYLVI